MDRKNLLKIEDPKILKRKINIYNIINGTNYHINDFGIFEYGGNKKVLNYYGISLNSILFNKLDFYKKNYFIAKRWLGIILNNCEIKNNNIYYLENNFILNVKKNRKMFILNNYIFLKFNLKFGYSYLNNKMLISSILEEYFGYKGFGTYKNYNSITFKNI